MQFGPEGFRISFAGWAPLDSKVQDLTPTRTRCEITDAKSFGWNTVVETRSYNVLVFRKHHLALTYFALAFIFISFPVAIYFYYKFRLSSYKNLFALASLLSVVALYFYLLSLKAKLLFDGQRLLYEKARLHSPRLVKEQRHIGTDHIKNVELRKNRSDHQGVTIACFDGYLFYFAVGSEDAGPFVNWLNRECKNKISEKQFADKDSYKTGFLIIGTIVLDIILIFVAVYLATN